MTTRPSLLLTLLLISCASRNAPEPIAPPAPEPAAPVEAAPAVQEVSLEERLSQYLSGTFDSAEQAAVDESYYAVSLTSCAMELPELGERVLYVEQALIDKAPYRQRAYVIEEAGAAQVRTTIYAFETPEEMTGFCDSPETYAAPAIGALKLREGCGVLLTWDGTGFSGGTNERDCSSDMRGATWASSEITILSDRLHSWDRGWDDAGEHIWGAEAGPYEFIRR